MPVILGIIVLFIHIAFFCHDRCIIQYICITSASLAAFSDDESLAESKASEEIEKRLIGKWDTEISVASDEETVGIVIKASPQFTDRIFEHSAYSYRQFFPKY